MVLTKDNQNKTLDGVETLVFFSNAACTNIKFETKQKIEVNIHPDDIETDKKNAKENDSTEEDITNNTYVMPALFDEPGSTVPAPDTGFERSGGVTGACAVTQNGTSQGFEKSCGSRA